MKSRSLTMKNGRYSLAVGNLTFYFSSAPRLRKFQSELSKRVDFTEESIMNRFRFSHVINHEELAAYQLYRKLEPENMRIQIGEDDVTCQEEIKLSVSIEKVERN